MIQPLLLAEVEPVLAISEIVIDFVSLADLQDMKDEDVDGQLRHYDDCAESEVVLEVCEPNPVVLRYLGLVGKHHDEQQNKGYEKESLCLARVGEYRTKQSFATLSFL